MWPTVCGVGCVELCRAAQGCYSCCSAVLTLVFVGDVVLSLSANQQGGQEQGLVQLRLQVDVVVAWKEGVNSEINDSCRAEPGRRGYSSM